MLKHRGEVVRQSTSGDGEVEVVVRIRARVPSQADDKSRREIVRAFNENFAGRRMMGAEAMVEFRPTRPGPAGAVGSLPAKRKAANAGNERGPGSDAKRRRRERAEMLAGESRAEREARKAARRAQISGRAIERVTKEDEHGQEAS